MHLELKPYKCDICETSFKSLEELKTHQNRVHLNMKSHECDYCGKAFSCPKALLLHKKSEHADLEKTKLKALECGMCDYKAYSKTEMVNHGFKHLDKEEKPYQCEECGRRFLQRSSLENHLKVVHLKIKDYVCKLCSKAFGTKENLKTHMKRIHS